METADASLARTLEALGDGCLGIFGAGHLGRALALGLTAAGFPASRLLLCHRGSPATRSAIEAAGLSRCVVTNDELCRRCPIVLVTIRPQDLSALASCPLRDGSLLVSFMAGTPLVSLPVSSEIVRVRVMPSAPYTITRKSGIAGVFPADHPVVREICTALGLATIGMDSEDVMHAFTSLGVCLPIALACWGSLGRQVDDATLVRLGVAHGLARCEHIVSWAHAMEPRFASARELQDFLTAAATRGGVTEAIIQAMRDGSNLTEALEAGIRRSRGLV